MAHRRRHEGCAAGRRLLRRAARQPTAAKPATGASRAGCYYAAQRDAGGSEADRWTNKKKPVYFMA